MIIFKGYIYKNSTQRPIYLWPGTNTIFFFLTLECECRSIRHVIPIILTLLLRLGNDLNEWADRDSTVGKSIDRVNDFFKIRYYKNQTSILPKNIYHYHRFRSATIWFDQKQYKFTFRFEINYKFVLNSAHNMYIYYIIDIYII